MSELIERFEKVVAAIKEAEKQAARPKGSVRLLAVSKTHEAAHVATLYQHWAKEYSAGHISYPPSFAESYAQEALQKQDTVAALLGVTRKKMLPYWYFIGHIQSRKAKDLGGRFACIQSVDSLKVAQNLHKKWVVENEEQTKVGETCPPFAILIQINIGEEPQKSGVWQPDAAALCAEILSIPGLYLRGFMGIAPAVAKPALARPYFAALRLLQERIQQQYGVALPELSMGMSDDYVEAIAEGATVVRVGSQIFGSRPQKL